ncbi:hypothetical protein [Pseudomonas graminis]|uniref:hypothetical protein n=1 Tax=Pseudomonas graminis TaxID=158627 RepID=UPI00105DD841|nr:hypothetical protein [Pseudomonas graminis]
MKTQNEDELRAWDQYVAAAFEYALKTSTAGSNDVHLRLSVKRAADVADLLIVERRARQV